MPIGLTRPVTGLQDFTRPVQVTPITFAPAKVARDVTQPSPELAAFFPKQEQIQFEKERRDEAATSSWISYTLGIFDTLLLGRSLRSAIAGFGSEANFNPVTGFLRGLPGSELVTNLFGTTPLNTTFSDIRKAFGNNDSDEGLGNFIINFLGDVVLDPTTYLTFGTAAVMKTATGDAVSRATEAMARQSMKTSGKSLETLVEQGIAANLRFHIPFTEIYEAVPVEKTLNTFGLKSMNINLASAIDSINSQLRSNGITGPLIERLGGSRIADPTKHAEFMRKKYLATSGRDALTKGVLQILQNLVQSNPELATMIERNPDIRDAIMILAETGVSKLDDFGVIAHRIENYEAITAARNFVRLYETNADWKQIIDIAHGGKFDSKLFMEEVLTPSARRTGPGFYDNIVNEIVGPFEKGKSAETTQIDAIKQLYNFNWSQIPDSNVRKSPLKLPQRLLEIAGLEPRLGVDVPYGDHMVSDILTPADIAVMDKGALTAKEGRNINLAIAKVLDEFGLAGDPDGISKLRSIANGLDGATAEASKAASQAIDKIDRLNMAFALSNRDPLIMMARKDKLLADLGVKSISELQSRRTELLKMAANARSRGDKSSFQRFNELAKEIDRNIGEINLIDTSISKYGTDASKIAAMLPPGYADAELESVVTKIKDSVEGIINERSRLGFTTEGKVKSAARQRAVNLVGDINQLISSEVTDPELLAVRKEIIDLENAAKSRTLSKDEVKRLRTLNAKRGNLLSQNKMIAGVELKDAIEESLQIHRVVMQRMFDAENAAGLINTLTENYVPRIMNPAAINAIEGRFQAAVSTLTPEGKKMVSSFMGQRKFTDLLTFEVNVLMEQIGSQISNYKGLSEIMGDKKLSVQKLQDISKTVKLNNLIFTPDWVNNTLRSIDREAAEFFMANPFIADMHRIKAGRVPMTRSLLYQQVFDPHGSLVNSSTPMSDIANVRKTLGGLNPETEVAVVVDDDRVVASASRYGEISSDITVRSLDTQVRSIDAQLREVTQRRIVSEGLSIGQAQKEYKESLKFIDDFMANPSMVDLMPKASDSESLVMVKQRLENVRVTQKKLNFDTEVRIMLQNMVDSFTDDKGLRSVSGRDKRIVRISELENQYESIADQIIKAKNAGNEQLADTLIPQVEQLGSEIFDLKYSIYRERITRETIGPGTERARQAMIDKFGKRAKNVRLESEIVGDAEILAEVQRIYKQGLLDSVTVGGLGKNYPKIESALHDIDTLIETTRDEIRLLEGSQVNRAAVTKPAKSIYPPDSFDVDQLELQSSLVGQDEMDAYISNRRDFLNDLLNERKRIENSAGYKIKSDPSKVWNATTVGREESVVYKYQSEMEAAVAERERVSKELDDFVSESDVVNKEGKIVTPLDDIIKAAEDHDKEFGLYEPITRKWFKGRVPEEDMDLPIEEIRKKHNIPARILRKKFYGVNKSGKVLISDTEASLAEAGIENIRVLNIEELRKEREAFIEENKDFIAERMKEVGNRSRKAENAQLEVDAAQRRFSNSIVNFIDLTEELPEYKGFNVDLSNEFAKDRINQYVAALGSGGVPEYSGPRQIRIIRGEAAKGKLREDPLGTLVTEKRKELTEATLPPDLTPSTKLEEAEQFKKVPFAVRNALSRAMLAESSSIYSYNVANEGVYSARAAVRRNVRGFDESLNNYEKTAREAQKLVGKNIKLAQDSLANPAMVGDEIRLAYLFDQNGYVPMDIITPEMSEQLEKRFAGKRLVTMNKDVWEQVQRHIDDISKPDTIREKSIGRIFDQITSWWSANTTMHPAFFQTRLRDTLQNFSVLALSGHATPSATAKAWKASYAIGNSLRNGTSLSAELGRETVNIRGATVPIANLIEELQRHGIIGSELANTGHLEGYLRNPVISEESPRWFDYAMGLFGVSRPKLTSEMIQSKGAARNVLAGVSSVFDPENNPLIRQGGPLSKTNFAGRGLARFGDDAARLTAVITNLERGSSLEEAIEAARVWTYGTGQTYTSFERNKLKRFLPFYGFLKWSASASTDLMLSNSKTLSMIQKVRQNAYGALGMDESTLNSSMPKFIEDGVGVPVVNTKDGPVFVTLGSLLPIQGVADLSNAFRNVLVQMAGSVNYQIGRPTGNEVSDSILYIARNAHPVVKQLASMMTNRDAFSGRELQRYPGEKTELMGIPMTPIMRNTIRDIRFISELDRMNVFNIPQFKVAMGAVERGARPGERKELDPTVRLLTSAFSPFAPTRAYLVDIEEDTRRQRARDESEINKIKTQLRLATETKKPATKDNVEALQKLLAAKIADIDARRALEQSYNIDPQKVKEEQKMQKRRQIGLLRGR